MTRSRIDSHNGVRFQVEAVPHGETFEGRFTLLDGGVEPPDDLDSLRPTTENAWATEHEALTYATEAAHHAIEGVAPFVGQGRGRA